MERARSLYVGQLNLLCRVWIGAPSSSAGGISRFTVTDPRASLLQARVPHDQQPSSDGLAGSDPSRTPSPGKRRPSSVSCRLVLACSRRPKPSLCPPKSERDLDWRKQKSQNSSSTACSAAHPRSASVWDVRWHVVQSIAMRAPSVSIFLHKRRFPETDNLPRVSLQLLLASCRPPPLPSSGCVASPLFLQPSLEAFCLLLFGSKIFGGINGPLEARVWKLVPQTATNFPLINSRRSIRSWILQPAKSSRFASAKSIAKDKQQYP